jgi:hypothetical protein
MRGLFGQCGPMILTAQGGGRFKGSAPIPHFGALFASALIDFPGAAAVGLRRERDQGSFPRGNTPEMD